MKICEICGKIQHYKKMDLRSYTKQELALLYFPDSDPDVARSHLMRWIGVVLAVCLWHLGVLI